VLGFGEVADAWGRVCGVGGGGVLRLLRAPLDSLEMTGV